MDFSFFTLLGRTGVKPFTAIPNAAAIITFHNT